MYTENRNNTTSAHLPSAHTQDRSYNLEMYCATGQRRAHKNGERSHWTL